MSIFPKDTVQNSKKTKFDFTMTKQCVVMKEMKAIVHLSLSYFHLFKTYNLNSQKQKMISLEHMTLFLLPF
jgi:hypothetical protein